MITFPKLGSRFGLVAAPAAPAHTTHSPTPETRMDVESRVEVALASGSDVPSWDLLPQLGHLTYLCRVSTRLSIMFYKLSHRQSSVSKVSTTL